MSKKEIRKELELIILKAIDEALIKQNAEAVKKIRRTAHEASKMVAKKFLKSLKHIEESKITDSPKVPKKLVVQVKKGTPLLPKKTTKAKK